MREISLYAIGTKIADSSGSLVPIGARPVVRWREKVSFEIGLPNNVPFAAGSYRYAFDYDMDFLDTEPCNAGKCTLVDGKLVFEVVFNSVRQAKATNGRMKPIPFFVQISTAEDEDDFAEYILLDAIWVAGCVWDGLGPPAPEAPNYYTKAEVDGIAERKLDKPAEPGETGYVLGLAEDGSTVWIPNGGGGSWGHISGDIENQTDLMGKLEDKANLVNGKLKPEEMPEVSWNDVQSKPTFSQVATSGNYADLSNKPAIPDSLSDLDSDTYHRTVTDEDKAAWDNKSDFSGSYNDLSDKPTIPPAQVQSDWTETNTGSKAYVKNKPTLATVATSGSYNDLNNKPTIPPAQVQADWNETSTSSKAYIQNKPTIPTATDAATNAQIDSRSASQDIRPSNVEYAVRSVLPNVTTIPAATTAYTLLDASATTNSHSAHYTHSPTGIPTYTLPAVTNAAIAHEILLDVDFTTVQACGFVDSQSAEIPLQSDISIAAGDKWRFICVYSLDGWRVYPLPIEVAGGGGTSTLIVQGTTATSAGLAGTYEITNDTVNDHPVWYNSTNSKYLWLVENGMDAGWFGWVIGSTVAQQSAGDIPMFYEYFVADVTSPADTPVGLTWRTQMDELTAEQFTCVEG